MPKRKMLSGFAGRGENRYQRLAPEIEKTTTKYIPRPPGCDLNRDQVFNFHVKASPSEFLRYFKITNVTFEPS